MVGTVTCARRRVCATRRPATRRRAIVLGVASIWAVSGAKMLESKIGVEGGVDILQLAERVGENLGRKEIRGCKVIIIQLWADNVCYCSVLHQMSVNAGEVNHR